MALQSVEEDPELTKGRFHNNVSGGTPVDKAHCEALTQGHDHQPRTPPQVFCHQPSGNVALPRLPDPYGNGLTRKIPSGNKWRAVDSTQDEPASSSRPAKHLVLQASAPLCSGSKTDDYPRHGSTHDVVHDLAGDHSVSGSVWSSFPTSHTNPHCLMKPAAGRCRPLHTPKGCGGLEAPMDPIPTNGSVHLTGFDPYDHQPCRQHACQPDGACFDAHNMGNCNLKSFRERLRDGKSGRRKLLAPLVNSNYLSKRFVSLSASNWPVAGSCHYHLDREAFDPSQCRSTRSYAEHVLHKANSLYITMVEDRQNLQGSQKGRDSLPILASDTSFGGQAPRPPLLYPRSSLPESDGGQVLILPGEWSLRNQCHASTHQPYRHHLAREHLQYHNRVSHYKSSDALGERQELDSHHDQRSPTIACSWGDTTAAESAYQAIIRLCSLYDESWIDLIHLAGCLAFSLGEFSQAITWFSKIAVKIESPVILSNLALTSIASKAYPEAETYWRRALRIQPTYLEAAEYLVSLLCSQNRHLHAVQAIDYVRHCLKVEGGSIASQCSLNVGYLRIDSLQLLGLLHAKGSILHLLHNPVAAAESFEETLSLSLGLGNGSLLDLVRVVKTRLSLVMGKMPTTQTMILLTPHQALYTMQACYGQSGYPPGLRSVSNMDRRQTVFSIASNALLSLAKILQDALFHSNDGQSYLPPGFTVGEILILYYLSLSIQPNASTSNNVGILLASTPLPSACGRQTFACDGSALAMQYYQYGLSLDPNHPHLYTNLGSLLKDLGRLPEAIRMYEKAVMLDPNFEIALANLANAFKDQGRTTEAIQHYKRAVDVNPNFVEAICGLANALSSICSWDNRGGVFMTGGIFDRWHIGATGQPNDALNSHVSSGWLGRVVEILDNQIAAGQDWGTGQMRSDDMDALLRHGLSDGRSPDGRSICAMHERVYLWCGRPSEGAKTLRLIERANRQTSWRWYHDVHVSRSNEQRHDLQEGYPRLYSRASLSAPPSPTVLPFHTFTIPLTAKQIRVISQMNGIRVSHQALRAPWLPTNVFPPPIPPAPQLHIGYISSDFNNHPLSHLMQSVFGMHDKTRITAFCYATTSSDRSPYREKIERQASCFYDVSSWSTQKLVQRVVQDGIHILVNLNGYTRGARNEVFAARPAPIQMSFMGFAGTLGAEWSDYLLADEIAVPQSTLRPYRRNLTVQDLIAEEQDLATSHDEWVYSENIIFTQDSSFCCDHRQSCLATDAARTWPEELCHRRSMRESLFPDLAPDAIILANFNQLYKIDPTTFRTWLRILSQVANAILWLLRFPASGEANLMRTARLWAPESVACRIRFTDVAPKTDHIARGCVADLFLDTPECNAHTTAADCLWSGTPLLTLPRYEWKMCSRMAAGILRSSLPVDTAAGERAFGELVVHNEDEYESRTVELARKLKYRSHRTHTGLQDWGKGKAHGRLMDLRKMIWENRWTCPLFDTKRWVRHLEVAYQEAWRKWVAGEGGDIWLKDLL